MYCTNLQRAARHLGKHQFRHGPGPQIGDTNQALSDSLLHSHHPALIISKTMPYSEETASYKVHYFTHFDVFRWDKHSYHIVIVQSYDAADQRSQCFHPFLHRGEFLVYGVFFLPPYFRYYLSYDQIIGMDLIESERIISCALYPTHLTTRSSLIQNLE